MPKFPIDYSKTLMYKIVCKNPDITACYVGQTTNFVLRKSAHRSSAARSSLRVYSYIRENGGWDNWTMVSLGPYPCANAMEAKLKESEFIVKEHATLNSNCQAIPSDFPPALQHLKPRYIPDATIKQKKKRVVPSYETWMKITAWIRSIDV